MLKKHAPVFATHLFYFHTLVPFWTDRMSLFRRAKANNINDKKGNSTMQWEKGFNLLACPLVVESFSSTAPWTAKAGGQRWVFWLCFDFISFVNEFVLAINTFNNCNTFDKQINLDKLYFSISTEKSLEIFTDTDLHRK